MTVKGEGSGLLRGLALGMAVCPLLLFAYLGQFSRLMSDDYCAFAVGQAMGAWDGMLYWYSSWSGSYANFFFKSALAPLDASLPALTPTLILLLWILGAIGSAAGLLRILCRGRFSRVSAVLLAAALITGGVNAAHQQTWYWFAASTHYTLPFALVMIFAAICLWSARLHSSPRIITAALLGFFICFLAAGASEIFAAFQLTVISAALLTALVYGRKAKMQNTAFLISAGWLASCVGFLLQAGSPGLAIRAAVDAERFGYAIRDLPELVIATLGETYKHIGHPPLFAGFMLCFCVGLFVMRYGCHGHSQIAETRARLTTRILWPLLFFEMMWMPLLWAHVSDAAIIFGRFSAGYTVVVALNGLLILAILTVIWQRRRIQDRLRERPAFALRIVSALLIAAVLLFAMSQIRSIHYRAAAFLFASAVALLFAGAWQLVGFASDSHTRRNLCFAALALLVSLAGLASVVFSALYGRGFVDGRVLAPADYLLMLPAVLLGMAMGGALSRLSARSTALVGRMSLTLMLIITMGLLLGHARFIPDFQRYAGEWDARHAEIKTMAANGETDIAVAPLTYDMANHVNVTTLDRNPSNRCAKRYYGLESIAVAES